MTTRSDAGEDELFTSTLVQVRPLTAPSKENPSDNRARAVRRRQGVGHGDDRRRGARSPSLLSLTIVGLSSLSCLQPIALGALLHLDGKISQRGLVSPSSEEVWRPLLASLEAAGLRPVERRQKGTRGVLETLEATVDGGQWA